MSQRFPSVTRYLAALPSGLESHPACTVHESVLDAYVRDHAALESSRAHAPRVELVDVHAEVARYRIEWTR